MMKTQIGLGILSVPGAFEALGIIPGVICLCAISGITTWSACTIGTFKLRHREVYGIDDVGHLIFGQVGRAILSVAFCLCMLLPLYINTTRHQTDLLHTGYSSPGQAYLGSR